MMTAFVDAISRAEYLPTAISHCGHSTARHEIAIVMDPKSRPVAFFPVRHFLSPLEDEVALALADHASCFNRIVELEEQHRTEHWRDYFNVRDSESPEESESAGGGSHV